MEKLILILIIYFVLQAVAFLLIYFKQRNALFWVLVTLVCTPIVTIIFMLCLGESEQAKEEKVDEALRTIALLEFEALCDFEEKSYLSRHMWKNREVYRERNAKKLARYREANNTKHITPIEYEIHKT